MSGCGIPPMWLDNGNASFVEGNNDDSNNYFGSHVASETDADNINPFGVLIVKNIENYYQLSLYNLVQQVLKPMYWKNMYSWITISPMITSQYFLFFNFSHL